MCLSPRVHFRVFCLSVGFKQFNYHEPYFSFLCGFCIWYSLSFLHLYVDSFHQIWKIFSLIALNISPSPLPLLWRLCCWVTKSCPTLRLRELQHSRLPSLTISQSFLKLMSIESVMPSNHLILCRLLLLPSIFPGLRSQWVSSSHQVGQSTGASASASVLPVTIQGWFALGLTGLISLLSKGLSKSLLQYHNSSVLSLLYGPTLISIHDYWKNHSFDYSDLCQQGDVSAF